MLYASNHPLRSRDRQPMVVGLRTKFTVARNEMVNEIALLYGDVGIKENLA